MGYGAKYTRFPRSPQLFAGQATLVAWLGNYMIRWDPRVAICKQAGGGDGG
jgi:hypothetical protein